jgi:low temperature requirement protein LtrA
LLAVFAVGLAFFGGAGRSDGFFALFLIVFLVFLATLMMGTFLRFPLAFALVFLLITITTSSTLNSILKVRSLPNQDVSQRVGHYFDRVIATDAKTVLERSVARYVAAVEGNRGYE